MLLSVGVPSIKVYCLGKKISCIHENTEPVLFLLPHLLNCATFIKVKCLYHSTIDRSTIFSELCKWRVLKRKFFTISGSLFIRKANALGTKSRTKTCRCKDKISNSTTSDINYFRKVINNARERWMWSKQSTRSHSAHEN